MTYFISAGPQSQVIVGRVASDYVHLTAHDPDTSASLWMLPDEARELATRLNAVADAIDTQTLPRAAADIPSGEGK
jgi:hypothetical protein